MLRQLLLYLMFIVFGASNVYGYCSVSRVILRIPRENDIGLFFDITLSNKKSGVSEMVEFSVTSEGCCTLNTSRGEQVLAGHIFGGDFGSIEPGNSMTVSLVWPTVSLYNRVGSCPITVSTVNHENVANRSQQTLYFDTRFETLDPGNHSLCKRKDFVNCRNWDQNYFKNCTPLDCEERYFGKRSYYNHTSEQCEPVPVCFGQNVIYDYYANECIDENNFLMDDDIELLKQGKYDENFLVLHDRLSSKMRNVKEHVSKQKPLVSTIKNKNKYQHKKSITTECDFDTKLSLRDFNNCFQHLNEPHSETPLKHFNNYSKAEKTLRKKSTSILKRFYFDWYLPLNAESETDNDETETYEPTKSSNEDYVSLAAQSKGSKSLLQRLAILSFCEWITLLLEMLLIILLVILLQVFLTIMTYAVVCLLVYGLMELLTIIKPCATRELTPPRDFKISSDYMTSASLMSQLK